MKRKTDGWYEADFPPIIDKIVEKAQERELNQEEGLTKRPKPMPVVSSVVSVNVRFTIYV